LEQTRHQVRLADVASSLMLLAAGSLIFFLAVALADHWLFSQGLSFLARLGLFCVWIAGAGAFGWRFLLPSLMNRINPVFAAQTIEQTRPTLKNSLINFLMLRSHPQDVAPVVYRAMEHRAAADLSKVPVDHAMERGRIVHLACVLAAVIAIFALYLALSPKNPLTSAARVLMPWLDLPAPTRVHIEEVAPGSDVVFSDEHQEITAHITGLRDGEEAAVVATTADNQAVEDRVVMTRTDDADHYRGELPAGGSGFQQDTFYRITAGDATTQTYKLEVQIAPTIVIDRIDYHFPTYTELADRSIKNQGDIKALEGTQVTIYATANLEIKEASIDLNSKGLQKRTMKIDGTKAVGQFTLPPYPDLESKSEIESYQIQFTDTKGHPVRRPVRYNVDIDRDLQPDIKIVVPDQEGQVMVPEDGQLTIRVRALDPDYALRGVTIHGQCRDRELGLPVLLYRPKPDRALVGAFEASYVFKPSELKLKAGDEVCYWATADDNKEPRANQSDTRKSERKPRTILIGRPGQRPQQNPADQPQKGDEQTKQPGDKPDQGDGEPGKSKRGQGDSPKESGAPDKSGDKDASGKNGPDNNGPKKGDPGKSEPEKSDTNGGQHSTPDSKSSKDRAKPDKTDGSGNHEQSPNSDNRSESGDNNSAANGEQPKERTDPETQGADAVRKMIRDKEEQEKNKSKQPDQSQGDPSQNPPNQGNDPGTKSNSQSNSPQGKSPQGTNEKSPQNGSQPDGPNQGSSKPNGDPKNGSQQGNNQTGQPQNSGNPGDQTGGKPGDKGPDGNSGSPSPKSDNRHDSQSASGKQPRPGDQNSNGQGAQPSPKEQGKPGEQADSKPSNNGASKADSQSDSKPGSPNNAGKENAAKSPGGGQENPTAGGASKSESQGGKPGGKDQAAGGEPKKGQTQSAGQDSKDPTANGTTPPNKGQQPGSQSGNDKQLAQAGQKPSEKSPSSKPDGGGSSPMPAGGEKPGSKPKEESGNSQGAGQTSQGKKPEKQDGGGSSGGGDKPKQGQGDKSDEGGASPKPGGNKLSGNQGGSSNNESGQKDPGKRGDPTSRDGDPEPQGDAPKGDGKPGDAKQGLNQPPNNAQSPSTSQHESKNPKSDTPGDRSGGGAGGGGQQGKNGSQGAAGSSAAADKGGSVSKEPGEGATGTKSGQDVRSPENKGSTQHEKGEGNGKTHATDEKPSASDKPQPPQDNSSKSTNSSESQNQSSGNSDSTSGHPGNQGSGQPAGGSQAGTNGKPSISQHEAEDKSDPADLAFSKKQVDLALNHLKDELAKKKPELLDRLGWTKEEAQKFADNLNKLKESAQKSGNEGEAGKKAYNEFLKNLDLHPHSTQIGGGKTKPDELRNVHDSGQMEAPSEYANEYHAYSRGTAQAGQK
jgi:hypothetical protein